MSDNKNVRRENKRKRYERLILRENISTVEDKMKPSSSLSMF